MTLTLDEQDSVDGEQSGFVVVDGVLWFTDARAFQSTFRTLVSMTRLASDVGRDETLARRAFELGNDFRSLATEIEERESRMTARGTRLHLLTVPDPRLQMMLSAEGELAIGPRLLLFDDDGIRELPSHALREPRTRELAAQAVRQPILGAPIPVGAPAQCWGSHSADVETSYGAGQDHRMIGYSWVSNISVLGIRISSIGARTVNQKRVPANPGAGAAKIWVASPATTLTLSGQTTFMPQACVGAGEVKVLNNANGNGGASLTKYFYQSDEFLQKVLQNSTTTDHSVSTNGVGQTGVTTITF